MASIFLQPACHLHKFNRPSSKLHDSSIVERPERLRAVYLGLATAVARLEEDARSRSAEAVKAAVADEDDLVKALEGLGLGAPEAAAGPSGVPTLVFAEAPDARGTWGRHAKAVKFVHEPAQEADGAQPERYLDQLRAWADASEQTTKKGGCEIPDGFPKNDLYREPLHHLLILKRARD